ncbi:adenylate/guanylate cyclase domain-containing protein [Phaeobacter inhibens]|uniref:adenylate/guanylate cyclase domain-containing protein n=1 Tax=Phaeobacter inhibens TaxID=221822 RepID=UPI0021A44DFC|nr:adenylate/guanylate cyclase domain-containing protein [Phaeobacter inhibens]UWR52769.1 adenylate/guanylate cyclase domain-containing protein [Phaeobacter inhibens]UWR68336.1 adenylate/guanylate cyclase domain-containing protein [Phaeobacter inhibens]UWR88284.1 adenylate/guanylate cyclase domain-containing protein [Phaeobacter inhibens]UWR95951.1 adenylate/guanylate cyclase domain-containing protein [Phaeobacter inhibens]
MAVTASAPAPALDSDEAIFTQESPYALDALTEHKRNGLELAVRARWVAMAVTAAFLVYVNPEWDVLYYHFILALLCLNGWLIRRVGRVGQSRLEMLLIFADLAIMTAGMVIPNPFSSEDLPLAIQYRYGNFIYFFIILAAGTLAYSWRTVIAIGSWTVLIWLSAAFTAWWFASPQAGLSAALLEAVEGNQSLVPLVDPNDFALHQRLQEAIVFFLVAVTLGVSSRRFYQLIQNNAGLERERANLSRYFSPNVVQQLSQNDEPLKQTRRQDVAILFIDIIGFTRLAAERDAYQVIDLLRDFHCRMELEVFRHQGTLDKYLGDGLMATFGTPLAGPHDATNALACARAMLASLADWNAERRRYGEAEIHVGIGVHFGETVLGNIGANRLEYAVIGNAVNIAARLEERTRELDALIVISEALRQRVQNEGGQLDLQTGFVEHRGCELRGLTLPMTLWVLPRQADALAGSGSGR